MIPTRVFPTAPPGFEKFGIVGPLQELGNGESNRADAGIPRPGAIAISTVGAGFGPLMRTGAHVQRSNASRRNPYGRIDALRNRSSHGTLGVVIPFGISL